MPRNRASLSGHERGDFSMVMAGVGRGAVPEDYRGGSTLPPPSRCITSMIDDFGRTLYTLSPGLAEAGYSHGSSLLEFGSTVVQGRLSVLFVCRGDRIGV